ncbi:unnamed protein product [Orchesella dallaii]|uniref:Uncharacterized protein n=1 Tax=Orchesella dallaii TaxID=48710 RepID=A0ABP1R0R4_9HEXA
MWMSERTNGASISEVEEMGQNPNLNLVQDGAKGPDSKPILEMDEKMKGLFAEFYRNQTATSAGEKVPGEMENPGDFGDVITHAVLKVAVALADTGLQATQQILKTTGFEILEAFRMKREAE